MSEHLDVFISSKMLEFQAERQALSELLPNLSTESVKIRAWIYEADAQASSKPIRDVYLKALEHSSLYIGLFGQAYGTWTIDEYEHAVRWGISRHLYIRKLPPEEQRDEKLETFLQSLSSVQAGLAPIWFEGVDNLCSAVERSVRIWLDERSVRRPGSANATLLQSATDILERPRQLIGREQQLVEADRAFRQKAWVLLHGFAGTGKTALAAEIAAQHLMAGQGPVLWQRAGDDSIEVLAEAIARPFGVQQELAGLKGDDLLRGLRHLLTENKVNLIVLDDVWNEDALLQFTKAVPQEVVLLVTSRHKFPTFKLLEIGRLGRAASLDLLSYYAQTDWRPNKDADLLCERLGDNAFALRVAGMNLNVEAITPTELLEHLRRSPHQLIVPMGFAEYGQTSVAELLEVSLNSLRSEPSGATAAAVFLRMGAHFAPQTTAPLLALHELDLLSGIEHPGYSGSVLPSVLYNPDESNMVDAVIRNKVRSLDIQETEKALAVLVQRGLAEQQTASDQSVSSFRLHELAYSYARAQNTDQDHFRAVKGCLYYLSAYNQPDPACLAVLWPLVNDFIGAADWAATHQQDTAVVDFALNLYSQGSQFLNYGGFFGAAHQLQNQALEITQRHDDLIGQARFKINLANLAGSMGHIQEGLEAASEALEITRSTHDRRLEREALSCLGILYSTLVDYDQALACEEAALVINRELGDKVAEAGSLNNLGVIHRNRNALTVARDYFEQAHQCVQDLGDPRLEASLNLNLGNIFWDLKQYDRALACYKAAHEHLVQVGDRRGLCLSLASLGNTYDDLNQPHLALECLQLALTLAREIGDRLTEAGILNTFGAVYYKQGRYQDALDTYQAAREIYAIEGISDKLAVVEYNLRGTRETLDAQKRPTVHVLNDAELRQEASRLRAIGDQYRKNREPQRALEFYLQAEVMQLQSGDYAGRGITLINRGSAYGMLRQFDAAIEAFTKAKECFEQVGDERYRQHAEECIIMTQKAQSGEKLSNKDLPSRNRRGLRQWIHRKLR